MLLRICLIIAVVGGLAAAVVNYVKVKEVITNTIAERESEKSAKVKAQDDAKTTHAKLATATNSLAAANRELATTKTALQAANAKVSDLQTSNTDLAKRLQDSQAARDKAEQDLAQWKQLNTTPQQVVQMTADLKKVTSERDAELVANKLLDKSRNELQAELDKVFNRMAIPPLPTGLKGTILAVDPKYAFVVLDIGRDKGVVPRGVMLVARDGKFLGKVQIERVLDTQSVANVMPAWTQGEIMEGDQVIY